MKAGVQCYGCDELQEKLETVYGEKITGLPEKRSIRISEWIVTPFYLPHDNTPNFGFLIDFPDDAGRLLYATDYEYIPYTFKNQRINHMLLECNHMNDSLERDSAKYEHVIKGHSSVSTVRDIILANKTPDLRNVILCHLSSENADPDRMKQEIRQVAGKWVSVEIAEKGFQCELSKYPF